MLANRSLEKEDKSNIITLGSIAKKLKREDPTVINSTIGMMYDEDGKLFVFDSINKVLAELSNEEKFAYAPTEGTKDFQEALKKWLFKSHYELFKDNVVVSATPGGSGALSNSFSNYLNEGDKALLPSFMWGNYKQMLYENNQGHVCYDLFDEYGCFNLEDLKKKAYELKKTQDRILIVVNDPCQNPTGYSMRQIEFRNLIVFINELAESGTKVILVHDLAYQDFDVNPYFVNRSNLELYDNIKKNVLVILAFSGSKSFGLYGLRVGAMVGISKEKEVLEEFSKANKFSSRSKWSNTTNMGMNLISKIILDDKLLEKYVKEINYVSNLLNDRANLFKSLAIKYSLPLLNYKSGFFLTIPTDHPWEVYEDLVKEKIHIIPMDKCIRVTLSSITMVEIEKMVPVIAKIIKLHN
ncbi:MAG: aminotransferase class I/II-fold pyridoxal phosphate-dependent enzyme [Acholeplasmatales bacterium]|nr:aminotransferase class I/II-fold pyridoxal phosphate-dependent enzyme [Acholeplasmatales bacterium]